MAGDNFPSFSESKMEDLPTAIQRFAEGINELYSDDSVPVDDSGYQEPLFKAIANGDGYFVSDYETEEIAAFCLDRGWAVRVAKALSRARD